MRIPDSVVVVSGASSGIGAATARAMAAAGARVALLARGEAALQAVAAAAGGNARPYPVDLTDPAAVAAVAARITADLGTPDVLIHCAGAGRWLYTEETSPEEAVQMMAVPYFAAFNLTRAFLPAMQARRRGTIVTVGSPASRLVWRGAAGYTAARWALQGFTEALRTDLRYSGLCVLSVIPALVATPYFARNPGTEARQPYVGHIVRALRPDEVAAAIRRGIERGRRQVLLPGLLGLFYLAHRLAPGLVSWLLTFTPERRRAKA